MKDHDSEWTDEKGGPKPDQARRKFEEALENRLLAVVHTQRDARIRIISARLADGRGGTARSDSLE